MRLNRGSIIFVAVLALVIIAAFVFLNTEDGAGGTPTAVATSATITIFPNVQATTVTSLTISSRTEIGDTRPTPIPGNPPLATLTPLPEGTEAPTELQTLSLQYDAAGIWALGTTGTVTSTNSVVQQTVTSALGILTGLRSTQQFTPENGDYAQYGLDNPTHDIRFVVQLPASTDPVTGQASVPPPQSYRLRLGNRSVDNTQFFAFLNDDSQTVYVISGAASLDSSVLRLVTQPPFTPDPTATPQTVLNVPGLVFGTFNLNLATRFVVTDNETGTSLILAKAEDQFTWLIENGDPSREVDQMIVSIYLTEFGAINAVSRSTVTDLSTVGLDTPKYTIEATMADGRVYTLRVGNSDPTNTLYYTFVDQFEPVVLVEAGTVAPFIDLLANPPYLAELTPEATVESTADALEATAEVTPEATAANGN